MFRRRCILGAGSAGVFLLAAWPAAAAPHSYTVVIDKLKFGPVPAQLHKGDTIVWVNHDILRHSATASDHSFDVGLPAGATGETVLTKTGTILFACKYHPGMRGALQVK